MPVCRLCTLNVPSFVKSHIYPRALNQPLGTPAAPLAVVMRTGGVTKSQTGIYESFLCDPCEALFSEPERHFISFVRQLDYGQPTIDSLGTLLARHYSQSQANPKFLRLYANSLLLRTHLANHKFFETVRLGSHYDRLRSLVTKNDVGSDCDFSLLLFRYTGPLGRPARSPQRIKLGEANGLLLSPPGIQLLIKVDKRPLPRDLEHLAVKEGRDVTVIHHPTTNRDFAQTIDLTNPFRGSISRILKQPSRKPA